MKTGDDYLSEDEIYEDILSDLYPSMKRRYFKRDKYRKFPKTWLEFLDHDITKDEEFLEEFRMSKASFLSLNDIPKGDEISQNNDDRRRGRKQPRDIVSREYLKWE